MNWLTVYGQGLFLKNTFIEEIISTELVNYIYLFITKKPLCKVKAEMDLDNIEIYALNI